MKDDKTLTLKGIKFRGTKTKGHEYKLFDDAYDEGSPNTIKKNKQSCEATNTNKDKREDITFKYSII